MSGHRYQAIPICNRKCVVAFHRQTSLMQPTQWDDLGRIVRRPQQTPTCDAWSTEKWL